MTDKDTALRLALEALENASNAIESWGSYASEYFQDKHDLQVDINNTQQAITAIKAALEAKDEPVAHSVVAGALFDFMGWLTSREKRLILSSVDEASPAVEAITEFAKKRNLSLKYAEVGYWMEFLSTPPPVAEPHKRTWVGLTEQEQGAIMEDLNAHGTRLYEFAVAIEAKLKEKNSYD